MIVIPPTISVDSVAAGPDDADVLVYTPPVIVNVDRPPVPVCSGGAGSVEYRIGGTDPRVSGSAEETAVAGGGGGNGNDEVPLLWGAPLLPGPDGKPGADAEDPVALVGVAALQAARDGVTVRVSMMVSVGKP